MQRKIFFSIVFLISLSLICLLYRAFLYDMVIAGLLCVASYWIKDFLSKYLKSEILASFLSVCALLMLVIIPLYFVIYRGIVSLMGIDWTQSDLWLASTKEMLSNLVNYIPFFKINDFMESFSFSSLASYATIAGKYITKGSFSFAIDMCFIVIFLFVFFFYGHKVYQYIKKLLPFKDDQFDQVALEVSGVLRVVFFSSVINVCLQGFAFGIVVWCFGLDGILLGVLYGLCSMIPVIGGILIWLPVAFFLYAQGNLFEAIFVAIYSFVFIGFVIDSVVKPFLIGIINRKLLKKPLNINEFVIFFAILAGLGAFGFWGIVIGPAITAFFIAILRIYERDFVS